MSTLEILQSQRSAILSLAAKHGASNVRLFGSLARGEGQPESDIDFLVEMEKGRSLLDLVALWQDLEELLGQRVDVVESEGLHWYIRNRVLQEAVLL